MVRLTCCFGRCEIANLHINGRDIAAGSAGYDVVVRPARESERLLRMRQGGAVIKAQNLSTGKKN